MIPASVRRLAVVLAATVGVAACGADAVSPLPVQPPGPTRSTPTPLGDLRDLRDAVHRRRPAGARPHLARQGVRPGRLPRRAPRRRPVRASAATPAGQGAVRHDLPLAETEIELLRSLCFATGAVLRIQGIGPGPRRAAARWSTPA
ncbi:hypothetical protein ACTFTM_12110 [Micromonospora sp. RB23]